MKLLGLIPARGGSKAIPYKNSRLLSGKPLLNWSIESALASPSLDHVVVSTDDECLAQLALEAGANVPFLRPSEFATDTSPGIDSAIHALEKLPDFTHILYLQPTSPLRSTADIEGIISFSKYHSCESIVSLCETANHPAWMFDITEKFYLRPLLQSSFPLLRQNIPPTYVLNGALYFASRDFLMREKTFITSSTLGYVMPSDRSVDIDTMEDWYWAEFLLKQRQL